MKKSFTVLFLFVSFFTYSNQNEWQDDWIRGLELMSDNHYLEAKEILVSTIENMSDNETQNNPEVILKLSQINNFLGNYDEVLEQTKELILSTRLLRHILNI